MHDETIVEPRSVPEANNNDNGDVSNNNQNGGGNKNNRTILIVVIVAVVLCCCCVVAGVAGYYAYTKNHSVKPFPVQQQPSEQIVPQVDYGNDGPPIGGLGNDILKNDTWNAMSPVAVALGCDRPVGANSSIEVIQQPDANGVWVEHWTVACESGDTYVFEVQYILDDTGATYNIKPLK